MFCVNYITKPFVPPTMALPHPTFDFKILAVKGEWVGGSNLNGQSPLKKMKINCRSPLRGFLVKNVYYLLFANCSIYVLPYYWEPLKQYVRIELGRSPADGTCLI